LHPWLVTIRQLRKLFAQFGIPNTLVSDNGPQFAAVEFHEFCRLNGIRHTRVAPYHPSSNELAERAMRVVKDGLKKQQGGTLLDQLSRLLFQYKITPQTTTSIAPAELFLGRKPRSRMTGHPQANSGGESPRKATATEDRSLQEVKSSSVCCRGASVCSKPWPWRQMATTYHHWYIWTGVFQSGH